MKSKVVYLLLSMVIVMLITSCGIFDDDDDDAGGNSNTGAGQVANADVASSSGASEIRLNAFSDFNCSSNWTNRDGALGLKAHTGSGTCRASFPGISGRYRVQIKVQAERDGAPPYSFSINGVIVKSGHYPYATGQLACGCSYEKCPDRNKMMDVGTFQINQGDIVELWADQVYPCGHDHGAYAKWHEMIFTVSN